MSAPVYGLTPSQADCARVIAALTDFEGKSPSYDEITVELGFRNKGQVHRTVERLIERGWIKPPPKYAIRALRLTRSPPPFSYSAIAITEAGREYLEDVA